MANAARSSIASSHSVLLINPPSPPGMRANREGAGGLGAWSMGDAGFIYPPQTLAFAAAVLRSAGWGVRLLDATGRRLSSSEALAEATASDSAIIAVHVAIISLDNDVRFLNELRSRLPAARLLAVGAGMPFAGPQLLERTDVDHVVLGEPEATLVPVCQILAGAGSVRRLHRTVSHADVMSLGVDRDGRLVNLDDLPFPAWDLVGVAGYGFLTVQASRGCNDTCRFCPYVVGQGRRFRARRPDRVVDELAWLAASFRPRRVIFRDPVFALERSRVVEICQGVRERRISLAWECESRPEHFDAELLGLMKQAGCTTVKLGLETTNAHLLAGLRRVAGPGGADAYLEQTANVVAACRSLGLACRLFVMTGLPGQSDEDIAATVRFLLNVRPTAVHARPFHHYPGLPLPPASVASNQETARLQAKAIEQVVNRALPSPGIGHRVGRWLRRVVGQ